MTCFFHVRKLIFIIPPTTTVAATGTGDFTSGVVASSGATSTTLAADIASYLATVTVADSFGSAGDIIDLQITGASVAGTDIHYLVINDAVADYSPATDAVIALTGTSTVPALTDFM